jgi:hypothetical protein
MQRPILFSLFAKIYRPVRIYYLGALNRLPKSFRGELYAKSIKRKLGLIDPLLDHATSKKNGNIYLATQRSQLVGTIYQALLDREPEPAALAQYSELLSQTNDIAPLLSEIAGSQEHWHKSLSARAPELVGAIFQALLDRDPEPAALAGYSESLAQSHDLTELVRDIANSEERINKYSISFLIELEKVLLKGLGGVSSSSTHLGIKPLTNIEQVSDFVKSLLSFTEGSKLLSALHSEYIVKEVFIATLGRDPDEGGLDHHARVLRSTNSISSLVKNLLHSTEFKEKLPKLLTLSTQALAVSNSSQIEADQYETSDAYISKAIAAYKSEIPLQKAYANANPGIKYQLSLLPRLDTPRVLSLIFVPSGAWLPFACALADHVRTEFNSESVLVWDEWSPVFVKATSFSQNIFESVGLHHLKQIDIESKFQPITIFTHSFGWVEQSKYLIDRFPHAKLLVYGDAYKNEVAPLLNEKRTISGAVFFGYRPLGRKVEVHTIIPASDITSYFDKAADIFEIEHAPQPSREVQSKYAVVYLRYWGIGPYAFSSQDCVTAAYDTISKSVKTDTRLVLKKDSRGDQLFFKELSMRLKEAGYTTTDLGNYLLEQGVNDGYQNLPVEYLLRHGLLTNAQAHVVFDSSLSYIIATSPYIACDTDLILGGILTAFHQPPSVSIGADALDAQLLQERGVAPRSIAAGVDTICRYSKHYVDAIMNSSLNVELLETDAIAYFAIRLRRITIDDSMETQKY